MELPVTSTKKLMGLNSDIEILVWEQLAERQLQQLYRAGYHQLFVFRIGGGIHEIDSKELTIENYSFHVIPAGTTHRLYLNSTVPHLVINFTDEYLKPLSSFQFYVETSTGVGNKYVFNTTKETFNSITPVLDKLRDEHKQTDRSSIVLTKFAVIIFKLCYESIKTN